MEREASSSNNGLDEAVASDDAVSEPLSNSEDLDTQPPNSIEKEPKVNDVNDPDASSSTDHPVNEWMDILGSGHLRKKVVKPGKENTRPNRSDICTLKIVGKLEDGTVVEDEELTIQLGDMEVVQALDLAVALMDTEEEAIVESDSRFAYGLLGRSSINSLPEIPSNAKMIYDVVLKSVQVEPNIDELTHIKKRKIGNKKKERGNWWFKRKEYSMATHCYRRALECLQPSAEGVMAQTKDDIEQPSNAELQAILDDTLAIHNNLAAAQLQCEAYDAALTSVENVLRCQPQNVKALFRKGKIMHSKGEHAKAEAVLTQAAKLEPDDAVIQKELSVIRQKVAKDVQSEKNLYRKMLGGPKVENKSEKKLSNNKTTRKLTWSLLGGTAAAIAGIIAYRFMS